MAPYIRFVPNLLSLLRLVLALLFPFLPEQFWPWCIIGGGLSDLLDGWIARRWQVQSRVGAILDGITDKCFVLSALLTIALAGKFSLVWVVPLLARDLLVAFTAAWAALARSWESFRKMEVRRPGKVATVGQFLLLLVAVVLPAATPFVLWPAVVLSVVAAVDYGRLFVLELRRRREVEGSS